ncbi:hypothetical protein HaLaN_25692, partial [Haematococcus lacustris]
MLYSSTKPHPASIPVATIPVEQGVRLLPPSSGHCQDVLAAKAQLEHTRESFGSGNMSYHGHYHGMCASRLAPTYYGGCPGQARTKASHSHLQQHAGKG